MKKMTVSDVPTFSPLAFPDVPVQKQPDPPKAEPAPAPQRPIKPVEVMSAPPSVDWGTLQRAEKASTCIIDGSS